MWRRNAAERDGETDVRGVRGTPAEGGSACTAVQLAIVEDDEVGVGGVSRSTG